MNTRTTHLFMKIQYLVVFVALSSVSQFTPPTATAELTDMTTDFLEGKVQIVDFNYTATRFRLVENGAVIDVRNDTPYVGT